jgi:branched-chain amino acid transport system permease protein
MSATLHDLLALVWTGIVTGCLYAIGALGLVMVFKATRVVNFAHGNLAALAGFVVYALPASVGSPPSPRRSPSSSCWRSSPTA